MNSNPNPSLSHCHHRPVLLREALAALGVREDGLYLDATVGGGGHAYAIARRLRRGRLIGLDRDPQALERARLKLADFPGVRLIQANFARLEAVLAELGLDGEALDGALFDLGVSSFQLEDPRRGFSFLREGPLDMRLGPDATQTAADLVNGLPPGELARIIRTYGEERYAARIAAAIARRRREHGPLRTTTELARLIEEAVPATARRRIHPATRTFQALRIAVNDELAALDEGLAAAFGALRRGGVLVVIAFHSLEDRRVKRFLAEAARGCTCPPGLPACVCGKVPQARVYPLVRPGPAEVAENPRARSARLRAARKVA